MPASICDPVSNALRLSLSGDDTQTSKLLDNRLLSSTKSVLLSKVEFEESGNYQSSVLDGLKTKYVVIRPKKPHLDGKHIKKEGSSSTPFAESSCKTFENGLPSPKRILYPIENVQVGWGERCWSAGAGMQNVGNTCYLNSTLQALFHVPALANWLVSEGQHSERCKQAEGCVICGMRACLMATQKSAGAPIKPWQVYSKLRLICRHLTPGRQEDAHEFLRYLVEAMEKCYLNRFTNIDKLDQYSKETTPLNQILGGYLRSTVRCLSCQHLSTTYQHFQDLLLDIRKHSTLDEALDSFFSRERLEDLGYKCEACNKKVSATKQFFIERAPMVLCIALKRFSLVGGKLSKHIQFRKRITLNKYIYNKNLSTQLSYRLVGMVTHLGPSQNCGHYTAIGQAPNGSFYQFDDSCVRPLPLSAVLGTNAYIMYFEKDNSVPEETVTSQTFLSQHMPSTSKAVYGPQLPDNLLQRDKSLLKLTYYNMEEQKSGMFSSSNSASVSSDKTIILNNHAKKSISNGLPAEPLLTKQNGEMEKNIENIRVSDDSVTKNTFNSKTTKLVLSKSDTDLRNIGNNKSPEKSDSRSLKIKSPLQKLEEQMNKNDQNKHKNGVSKLVPYDSESSGDESKIKADTGDSKYSWTKKQGGKGEGLLVSTKATQPWTVSNEVNRPLLSPSLNGVVNNKVKEKEQSPLKKAEDSTSTSTLSPASVHSDKIQERLSNGGQNGQSSLGGGSGVGAGGRPVSGGSDLVGRHETLSRLQHMSHRGYGAPVSTWNGTQSNMGRQVFEERREERKRAHDAADDMDQGHAKRLKKYNNYNRFNNNNNNNRHNYNPFQEKQNRGTWHGGFRYHGDRRPPHHFHNKHYNKHKRFNRYGNGHHYPRHH